ncbi:TPA: hypothetical protein TXJ12_001804 [Streptococcus suis]|nr:hypothetical protein [Streptococcus suis]HEL1622949.1 hypothetical protein [Streptococcus suis]HEL2060584.1 hypothetical protein [Streptococcus suis]HEM2582889.1 hypothetical protein [Streptococcus suis]
MTENKEKLKLSHVLPVLPVLMILSFLISSMLLLCAKILSGSINLEVIYCFELIVIVLCGIFGKILISNRKSYFFQFFIVFLITVVLFFIGKNEGFNWLRSLVVFQFAVPLIHIYWNVSSLQPIRDYVKRSQVVFCIQLIFDGLVGVFLYFIGKNATNIDTFMINQLGISERNWGLVATIFAFLLYFLFPFIRIKISIKKFIDKNGIEIPVDNVLWGTIAQGYLSSLFLISIALNLFLVPSTELDIFSIIVLSQFYLSFNLFFWAPSYESINKFGSEKVKAISNFITIFIILSTLVLLDQYESEVVGILTWFLPVLLPTFIGEIYKMSEEYLEGIGFKQTRKMRKHIYWLTMLSFNTLLIYNILILFKDSNSKAHIKVFFVDVLEYMQSSEGNAMASTILSVFASGLIVLLSFGLGWIISKYVFIVLFKNIYLDELKGYFERNESDNFD